MHHYLFKKIKLGTDRCVNTTPRWKEIVNDLRETAVSACQSGQGQRSFPNNLDQTCFIISCCVEGFLCFFLVLCRYHGDVPGVDDVDVSHQVLPGQEALQVHKQVLPHVLQPLQVPVQPEESWRSD